jgi:hypothetical protein
VEFAQWLRSRNVPPGNIKVFGSGNQQRLKKAGSDLASTGITTLEEATEQNIRRLMLYGLAQANHQLLFVYWSGHGIFLSKAGSCLLLSDANRKHVRALEVGHLTESLRSARVGENEGSLKHQVLFFDTSFHFATAGERSELEAELLHGPSPKPIGMPTIRNQFVLQAIDPEPGSEKRIQGGAFSSALLFHLKNYSPAAGWLEPPEVERAMYANGIGTRSIANDWPGAPTVQETRGPITQINPAQKSRRKKE